MFYCGQCLAKIPFPKFSRLKDSWRPVGEKSELNSGVEKGTKRGEGLSNKEINIYHISLKKPFKCFFSAAEKTQRVKEIDRDV